MKVKLKISPIFSLSVVLFTAFLNHLLTFLAYNWHAGIDSYSYDVCGLQLVSGYTFDPFAIMYRPPLVPILKNILYLLFEGHPYILSSLLHLLGIMTVVLAYRLGSRFHKAIGFSLGILMALNLQISIFYHSISTLTFYLPLLILTVDCFIVWIRRPNARSLTFLIITTFLCCLTRTEAIVLIPVFFIFGWLGHCRFRHAVIFILFCAMLYNITCLWYYSNFGYWGITNKIGWALSARLFRPSDRLFNRYNGPASMKIYRYMNKEWPMRVRDIRESEFFMYTFNLLQKDFGYIEADKLFRKAFIEAVHADTWKFIRFTFLRILGHLDLYYIPGLNHKETPFETESGHLWGFDEQRMKTRQEKIEDWYPAIPTLESPLRWERRVLLARLYRVFGFNNKIPELPKAFKLVPNARLNESREVEFLSYGEGVLTERLWSCRDIDAYSFFIYWGQRKWSKIALKILKYWDKFFMPGPAMRINIHRVMWFLWIGGIFATRKRWVSMVLSSLLFIVLMQAFSQAVFSDNFGGRFALYTRTFLWLGASCGILSLVERWRRRSVIKK